MIDWRLRVLGLLAATLALAVPASASGAVTIGSGLVASGLGAGYVCPNSATTCTFALSALPSPQVSTAPMDGVIVAWQARATATAAATLPTTMFLTVVHPVPNGFTRRRRDSGRVYQPQPDDLLVQRRASSH